MSPLDTDLAAFVTRLREKLEAGARQYGNTSFERPLVDVAGWELILWSRLQQLRDRVAQAEQGGGDRG